MAGLVIENTKRILFQKIPKLREQYWEPAAKPKPKWMDRLQAAPGPHKPEGEAHGAGRALDIVLFSSEPSEREIADNLVRVFLDLRQKMGWSAVIYNRRQWDINGVESPRLFSTAPESKKDQGPISYEHLTHIHVEWRAANMNHNGFETELEKGLNKVISGLEFYLYFGGGTDAQKIRETRAAYIEKIKSKGGQVTDVLSIWTHYVVKIGDEVKRPGDPLETDLERARILGVPIIETSELDGKL